MNIADGNRNLAIPDRRIGGADAIRFDKNLAPQITVRKQARDVEVSLRVFVAEVTQFSAPTENGTKGMRISG